MPKVAYNDNHQNFKLSDFGLNFFNDKRISSGLPPVQNCDLIIRHDQSLIETIETLEEASYGEGCCIKIKLVNSDDYTIIRTNKREIVIDDPVSTVDNLLYKLNRLYYSDNPDMSYCSKLLVLIKKIIHSY